MNDAGGTRHINGSCHCGNITFSLVRPDAPEILLSLYSTTLAELESLPAEAGYRSAGEALTKGRMAAVEGAKSIEEIETAIGGKEATEIFEGARRFSASLGGGVACGDAGGRIDAT